jgi:(p)ppGpp synthase/HD superfamily hydrolase
MNESEQGLLTDRFKDALCYAMDLHKRQLRKGTSIPYAAHLLAVAATVIENGGDEEQAIAALLHDAVEDQGGLPRLEEIRSKYGGRVADIVISCTDSYEDPEPPWKERKMEYLASIPGKRRDAIVVSLADKLHNARAILADYRRIGEDLWGRFKGGREGTLWYYRSIVNEFKNIDSSALTFELELAVAALESHVNGNRPS